MNPIINDDAHIISTDIVTDNGMVHVVDRVLMPNMELTCPVCGMGFMTIQAVDDHTKTAHVVEKIPEASMPAEVMPDVEKAPEPTPNLEVMPVVAAVPEPLPPPITEVITEQMPVIAKVTGVFEVFYDSVYQNPFPSKSW